ncbi:unnamed protein product, partial [Medioppia subpectinata]
RCARWRADGLALRAGSGRRLREASQTAFSAKDNVKVIDSHIDAKQEMYVISRVMDLLVKDVKPHQMVKSLVDDMNVKYGPGFVGQITINNHNINNTELYFGSKLDSYITVQYRQTLISLYKPLTMVDFVTKQHIVGQVEAARKSKVQFISSYNLTEPMTTTYMNKLHDTFMKVTENFTMNSCFNERPYYQNSCYKEISRRIFIDTYGTDGNLIIVTESKYMGSNGVRRNEYMLEMAMNMTTKTTTITTTSIAGSATTDSEPPLRSSFSRFDDQLCEEIVSHLSLEDQTRCECVCKRFRRSVYRRVYSIDFRCNPLLHQRIKYRPPIAPIITTSTAVTTVDGQQPQSQTVDGQSSQQQRPQQSRTAVTASGSGSGGGGGRQTYHTPRLFMNITLYERLLRKCPHIREVDFNYLIDFDNYGAIVDTITRTIPSLESVHAVFTDRPCHQTPPAAAVMETFYAKFAAGLQRIRAHHRGRVRAGVAAGAVCGSGVGIGGDNGLMAGIGGLHDNGIQCLKWCTNVTHLNVIYNIRLARLFATETECHFRRLQCLEFSFKTKDKKRLEALIDGNHQTLRSVFVTNSGSLTPTAVYTLFTQLARCRSVRRLEISIGYEQRFDYNLGHLLQQIAAQCPLLDKLTISLHFRHQALARQTFESLRHFRGVRQLFVSLRCEPDHTSITGGTTGFSNTFFKCKPLNSCHRLTHLTLADILINDIFFYNADKHLPRLRYLYLFSCRNYYEKLSLTDISIKMLSRLERLETVMFSERQPKITDQCVHDLIDRCPRIRRVSFGNHSYGDRIESVRRARQLANGCAHCPPPPPPPLPPPLPPPSLPYYSQPQAPPPLPTPPSTTSRS